MTETSLPLFAVLTLSNDFTLQYIFLNQKSYLKHLDIFSSGNSSAHRAGYPVLG